MNELRQYATIWMTLKTRGSRQKKQNTKEYVTFNSFYIKFKSRQNKITLFRECILR